MEGIIAIAVIVVGVVAALVLTLAAFSSSVESEDQVKAVNFAREGLEVVRNIRDTNWLAQEEFDYNLKNPSSGLLYNNLIVNFDDTYQWTVEGVDTGGYADPYNCAGATHSCQLFSSANGYYSHSALGEPTKFYRVLQQNYICRNQFNGLDLYVEPNGEECASGASYRVGIEVLSKVVWKEAGQGREIVLEDHLFDWR